MRKTVPTIGAKKEQVLNIRDLVVLCLGSKNVKGGDLL